jgi:chromosome partitioning protein
VRRVVFNQKGGVGKSTICCNLAAISAARGRKTLVVDLDPQTNSTRYLLGSGAEQVRPTLAEFFNDYHNIFIDTPPAMNFYTRSALIAASTVLIPFDCDDFSRRALYQLMEDIGEIREDHNAELRVEGIVVNQYQPRANLPARLVSELTAEGLPMFSSYLSSSVKIRESHDQSQPMVHLFPKHKVTAQFEALWDEMEGNAGESPVAAAARAVPA